MKKKKKQKKQIKHFIPTVWEPSFLGFPLVKSRWNQLWDWKDLSDVNFDNEKYNIK